MVKQEAIEWTRLAMDSDKQPHFIHCLQKQGYVFLTLPPDFMNAYQRFLKESQAFFAQPESYKNQFRTPSLTGYMTPYPGLHEVFEMKFDSQDSAFHLPKSLSITPIFDSIHGILKTILGIISHHYYKDQRLLSLLDDSTLRLLHYDRVNTMPASVAEQYIPPHADSSLLTFSPKAEVPGLGIRSYDDLQWINADALMQNNQAIVFAGEILAYITQNDIPSLIHKADIQEMVKSRRSRLTTPFFLRARNEAVLASPLTQAPPLAVNNLSNNIDACRDKLAWKQLPYYSY